MLFQTELFRYIPFVSCRPLPRVACVALDNAACRFVSLWVDDKDELVAQEERKTNNDIHPACSSIAKFNETCSH